ncbi:MAG TPA: tetratricopeptide repeat protein [Anaerolineae bacterium]|nr:tetratricopeptide repeat protein [Anaerolineae bacterium]
MFDVVRWPPSWATLWLLPALFLGFTVHELAHALVAYLLGDTSQVERNRLSFNPLRHVSWLGVATFLLFGFGWAKPVWIDHSRFRLGNRAFGTFLVAIAGASANLALAFVGLAGMVLTMVVVGVVEGTPAVSRAYSFLTFTNPGPDLQGVAVALSSYVVLVNLLLGVFNLLPLPLFDGFHALVSLFLAIKTALRRSERATSPRPAAMPATEPASEASEASDASGARHASGASPAQIHFEIGLAYHREGQWDEAIARYRQATDHDGNFALAYYNLGLAYWAKGRLPLAISAFRAAVHSPGPEGVRLVADLHLHNLLRAGQDSSCEPGLPPSPLESAVDAGLDLKVEAAPALDRERVRGVWVRLAAGGVAGVILAAAAWLYVTAVTLMAAA